MEYGGPGTPKIWKPWGPGTSEPDVQWMEVLFLATQHQRDPAQPAGPRVVCVCVSVGVSVLSWHIGQLFFSLWIDSRNAAAAKGAAVVGLHR